MMTKNGIFLSLSHGGPAKDNIMKHIRGVYPVEQISSFKKNGTSFSIRPGWTAYITVLLKRSSALFPHKLAPFLRFEITPRHSARPWYVGKLEKRL